MIFLFFASVRNIMGLAIWDHLNSISGTETFSVAQMICNWAAVGARYQGYYFFRSLFSTQVWKGWQPSFYYFSSICLSKTHKHAQQKSNPKCWALFFLDFCPLFSLDPIIFCNLVTFNRYFLIFCTIFLVEHKEKFDSNCLVC